MRNLIHRRAKRSLIWKVPSDTLKHYVTTSTSLSEILNKCGLINKGGNVTTIKKRLHEDNIDYSHIPLGVASNKGRTFYDLCKMSREEVVKYLFVTNSKFCRDTVKRYLKHYDILPYTCENCKINPMWDNKPLSLQLDHINGIGNDNSLENLRWLCPNCHSQTETFAGRNNKK